MLKLTDTTPISESIPPIHVNTPSERPELAEEIARVFNEPADVASTRTFRKWKSMRGRDLGTFYREHASTFQRRMRRGVPHKFRWEAWSVVVGLQDILQAKDLSSVFPLIPYEAPSNEVAVDEDPDEFSRVNLEAMRELSPIALYHQLAGKPSKFASLIDIDIARTFPDISLFDVRAQQALHRILNAYANFAPHVGYCQGMNFVMGFIMLVSGFASEHELFWFFAILMSRYQLHGFFREGFPLLGPYIDTFDAIAERYAPELRHHFAQENVLPPVYLHQWYLTLFVTSLPLGTVVIVWDYILCTGLHSLLPITLSLLKVLQSFLLRLRLESIVRFLKSLRSSGDCDESKIGRMLIKGAEDWPIPEDLNWLTSKVDFAELLDPSRNSGRRRTSVDAADLVGFETATPVVENPLNLALKEAQSEAVEDELDDDSIIPAKESESGRDGNWGPKHPQTRQNCNGEDGTKRSLRFFPKVIGRR